MRIDKEVLIKQHFWILLGLFLILWFVCVALIKTSASEIGTKAKTEFTAARDAIKGAEGKAPKNDTFNKPWNDYGAAYRGQKEKVWSDAWQVQKDMFDWPSRDEQNCRLDRLKYPDDEVTYPERMMYREELWKTQFPKLEADMAPIEIAGGSGGYVRIMMPVPGAGVASAAPAAASAPGLLSQANMAATPAPAVEGVPAGVWDNFWQRVPTTEEMWLAQEDFWSKRELLHVIRGAVATIASFKEVAEDKDKDLPQGIVGRNHFLSELWDIDFMIEHKPGQWFISDRSTIKNVHPSGRTVPLSASPTSGGIHFVVKQGNKKVPFRVDGEPLAPGATAPFRKKWPVDSIDFKKPFEIEQEFETANCPIRQLIDLQLAKHSHRTNAALMASLTIKPAKQEDLNVAAPAAPGQPAAAKPAAPAAAAPDAGDFTLNHLPRLRYVSRTEQCRHIPIALHMIVDVAHMHEILVALSSSRLRVQTTQVQFRHISGFHPAATGAAGVTHVVAPDEDPYLVELVVYGIAVLYERFPHKGAKPADKGSGDGEKPALSGPAPTAAAGKAAPPTTGKPAAPPTTAAAGKAGAVPPGTLAPGNPPAPPSTAAGAKPGAAGGTPPATNAPTDAAKPAPPGNPTDKAKSPQPAAKSGEPKKS
jgi:hypothetical protein